MNRLSDIDADDDLLDFLGSCEMVAEGVWVVPQRHLFCIDGQQLLLEAQ